MAMEWIKYTDRVTFNRNDYHLLKYGNAIVLSFPNEVISHFPDYYLVIDNDGNKLKQDWPKDCVIVTTDHVSDLKPDISLMNGWWPIDYEVYFPLQDSYKFCWYLRGSKYITGEFQSKSVFKRSGYTHYKLMDNPELPKLKYKFSEHVPGLNSFINSGNYKNSIYIGSYYIFNDIKYGITHENSKYLLNSNDEWEYA